jgi:hypothetical protein
VKSDDEFFPKLACKVDESLAQQINQAVSSQQEEIK